MLKFLAIRKLSVQSCVWLWQAPHHVSERVTNRKAGSPQAAGGNKLQTQIFFSSPSSLLTKLFLPKTIHPPKPWTDNGSTNQYSSQLFYSWGMAHFMPSYLKNVSETPSAFNLTESESESHSQSCLTLCNPMDCPWNSGQSTAVGSLFLLQGISPTQGSNPGLPHCRQILYQLSHKRSPRILERVAYPFCNGFSQPRIWTGVCYIAGWFITNWNQKMLTLWKESYDQPRQHI